MDDATRILAMEWFDRDDHDLETARILFVNHGFSDSIALHIQQALEKYLKGYLVFSWKTSTKKS